MSLVVPLSTVISVSHKVLSELSISVTTRDLLYRPTRLLQNAIHERPTVPPYPCFIKLLPEHLISAAAITNNTICFYKASHGDQVKALYNIRCQRACPLKRNIIYNISSFFFSFFLKAYITVQSVFRTSNPSADVPSFTP